MSKGYFYFHNNLPVISTERMPERTNDGNFLTAHSVAMNESGYQKRIKEWERQLIPAENVWMNKDMLRWYCKVNSITKRLSFGQAIEYEGNVIHKIIKTWKYPT